MDWARSMSHSIPWPDASDARTAWLDEFVQLVFLVHLVVILEQVRDLAAQIAERVALADIGKRLRYPAPIQFRHAHAAILYAQISGQRGFPAGDGFRLLAFRPQHARYVIVGIAAVGSSSSALSNSAIALAGWPRSAYKSPSAM